MKESIGSLGGKYPVWVLSPGLVTASLFQLLTFLFQIFFFFFGGGGGGRKESYL